MSKGTRIAGKLALAGLAGFGALLAAELAIRVFRPVGYMEPGQRCGAKPQEWRDTIHRASETAGLAYELAPDLDVHSLGVRVTTNSLGMRDREPLPASTPGLVRVLALGDSVTFGYRVEEPEAFASVLERELAGSPLARQRVFDVLNVGVSGYSTRDEVAALEGKWIALEPRLVVLGYCLNDPEILPLQPLQRAFVPPEWWQSSQLLRLIAQKRRLHGLRTLGGGNLFLYLHAPGEPAWRSVAESFARLGELARARRFSVVLAIFPMFSPAPWASYELRGVHAQVAAEGAKHGFAVLDLLARFEREDPTGLLIEPSDSHPNARGHRIAADELLRFLESRPELLESSGVDR